MKKIISILMFASLILVANPVNLQKSCDNGDLASCNNLGILYSNEKVATQSDYKIASELFGKACEGGYAYACNNLGILTANGTGVNQDINMAILLYKKACDGNDFMGCHNAGYMYDAAFGVARDQRMAKDFYAKSCEMGGYQPSCDRFRELKNQGF